MNPRISVIIPCYKQAHFLAQCITSLQAQTMKEWEGIVVDDGSPDNVVEIVGRFASADTRISLISKENGGLSSARNAGLATASGDLFQFLDADDVLLPDKFQAHIATCMELPVGTVTYTNYRHGRFDQPYVLANQSKHDMHFTAEPPILDLARRWEHSFSIPIHAPLFPREIVSKLGREPFDTALPNHEDWDFWMRVARVTSRFHFIDQELAIYRVSQNSMSRNSDAMWHGFNLAIAKQQRLNKGDRELQRSLRTLAYRNNVLGRRGLPGILRSLTESGPFCRLPSQVQYFTRRTLGVEW